MSGMARRAFKRTNHVVRRRQIRAADVEPNDIKTLRVEFAHTLTKKRKRIGGQIL
jgi:hypothetical protein